MPAAFPEDPTFRWVLVVFAIWASVVLALLLWYLYSSTVSFSAQNYASMKYTRVHASGASLSAPEASQHDRGTVGACPVVMSSEPSRDLARGLTVCLEVGQHADVTKALTFRPRYIRVAAGYSLIAYGQRYFGEPVQFKISGPAERVIEQQGWALEIMSCVVHMSITADPDIKACRLGATVDGQEVCLAPGTHPTFPGLPTKAVLQTGYRATVYPGADLVGEPMHDVVGPHTFSAAAAAAPWGSVSVQPCGVTLFAEPGHRGRLRVCSRSSLPTLDFRPQSLHVAEGCSIQAFARPDFTGNMLFRATGPITIPQLSVEAQSDAVWRSLRIECGAASKEGCVTLSASNGAMSECLEVGFYTNTPTLLGFVPSSVSIPLGMRIVCKNRLGEVVYNKAGAALDPNLSAAAWTDISVTAAPR